MMNLLFQSLLVAVVVTGTSSIVSIPEANIDGARYFVNTKRQPSSAGKHFEVHREGCGYLKRCKNCEYIGTFLNCSSAIIVAKNRVNVPSAVDGCNVCSKACNTD